MGITVVTLYFGDISTKLLALSRISQQHGEAAKTTYTFIFAFIHIHTLTV